MRAKSTAPKARDSGAAGSSGNQTILTDLLPRHILDRLHQANVHTFAQWRALGSARYAIFGITNKVVQQIDALAEVSK